ncbi:MAG: amidohydrolase [Bacillota bacterium]
MTDLLARCTDFAPELIELRREIHRYPELGWLEFRTTDRVARVLEALGYQVLLGEKVVRREAAMGAPSQEELAQNIRRAISEGAREHVIHQMRGLTGVVGVLDTHVDGPTIAFRVDMDALPLQEAETQSHRPYREGFSSLHQGVMHACGHDGHVAVGVGLARLLAEIRAELKGKVKLIFQPAEEGVRGARAMVEAGIADDVDYFLAFHLGLTPTDQLGVVCRSKGFLSTTKIDARFLGKAAHAGVAPEQGRNALLAAATAVLNVHAIAPSSQGVTRVNVGYMEAGSGRNIVPDKAVLKLETRGATDQLNEYVRERAIQVLEASARMYGVRCELEEVGQSGSAEGDVELAVLVGKVARAVGIELIVDEAEVGGSEDATLFMSRVQRRGGKALYYQVLTPLAADHHNNLFDFDERAIPLAVAIAGGMVREIASMSRV